MQSPPPELDEGDRLSQEDIEDLFDTGFGYQVSGINPRRDENDSRYVLLFATEDGPYEDDVSAGRFEYVGEGLEGDQSESSPGNSTLIDTIEEEIPIYFFYSSADADGWEYQGRVDVVEYEFRERNGRQVLVFTMEHVDDPVEEEPLEGDLTWLEATRLEVKRYADQHGWSVTLDEFYVFAEDRLSRRFPDNNNVRAKIRQQLQRLRDEGDVEFLGDGEYRITIDELTEPENPGPPEEIPSIPDLSVTYADLDDEEAIGQGGNAEVYRAPVGQDGVETTLAVKLPRMSGTIHLEAAEQLMTEAETWSKLDDHDHIVGVVDYEAEPLPWVAMEYMDGGHLGERLDEFDTRQALWTALAITEGVWHAHQRGVAHLDLKPENVLFRECEGAWDAPKVADWGLSKHLLNHSQSVEGLSPEYAAPEQFDEDYGQVDHVTDIYQLGAVFYELFTGETPFEGPPAKAMYKVLNETPNPPSEHADLPPALDDLILRMLSKDPSDRHDALVIVRNELQEIYEDH